MNQDVAMRNVRPKYDDVVDGCNTSTRISY